MKPTGIVMLSRSHATVVIDLAVSVRIDAKGMQQICKSRRKRMVANQEEISTPDTPTGLDATS
jgi:hypothetical protein